MRPFLHSYVILISTTAAIIPSKVFNPYLTNGFSHRYLLGEFSFILGGVRSDFFYFFYRICR